MPSPKYHYAPTIDRVYEELLKSDCLAVLLLIVCQIGQIVGQLSRKILRLHNFYFSVCVILARVLQITQSATLQGVVRFLHLFKFGLVVLQNLFLEHREPS